MASKPKEAVPKKERTQEEIDEDKGKFSPSTKENLQKHNAFRCANPDCRQYTLEQKLGGGLYAAFWAFMWEAELAALALTLKRVREPKLTASELDQYDAETRKKHIGQILDKELGELLKGQPDLKQFCVNTTDSRNRLMHRFYEEQLPLLVDARKLWLGPPHLMCARRNPYCPS
jgi:hypothetical protein